MQIWTDAINPRGYFDPRYTCDIDNSSPELQWDDPPPGTASFAIIGEEQPEIHDVQPGQSPSALPALWLIYDIPASLRRLPAGIPPQDTLPHGIHQGINSWGKLGYTGPCPPAQQGTRRYLFRLFALGIAPQFTSRLSRDQLVAAIEPWILSTAETSGLYERAIQRAG